MHFLAFSDVIPQIGVVISVVLSILGAVAKAVNVVKKFLNTRIEEATKTIEGQIATLKDIAASNRQNIADIRAIQREGPHNVLERLNELEKSTANLDVRLSDDRRVLESAIQVPVASLQALSIRMERMESRLEAVSNKLDSCQFAHFAEIRHETEKSEK